MTLNSNLLVAITDVSDYEGHTIHALFKKEVSGVF